MIVVLARFGHSHFLVSYLLLFLGYLSFSYYRRLNDPLVLEIVSYGGFIVSGKHLVREKRDWWKCKEVQGWSRKCLPGVDN